MNSPRAYLLGDDLFQHLILDFRFFESLSAILLMRVSPRPCERWDYWIALASLVKDPVM